MKFDNILVSDNAYFYKRVKTFDSQIIEALFNTISSDKIDDFLLNEIKEVKNLVTYSICVYKFYSKPNFLDESVVTETEIKYAFIIIIEYDDYVVISKRNISSLKTFNDYIDNLDYLTLSRLYVTDKTLFEKFNMLNMNISDRALRNKTVQAINLKDNFSSLGANKYILQNIRIRENNNLISMAFNTSKISRLSTKNDLENLFNWIVKVVEDIKSFKPKDTYLDIFAQSLDFAQHINTAKPIGILFDFSRLLEQTEKIEYNYLDGRKISIEKFSKNFSRLFLISETTLPNGDIRYEINTANEKKMKIDKTLILKKNKISISIQSKKLENIVFHRIDRTKINLTDYLRNNSNFLVTFDSIDLVYYTKKLFRDSRLMQNIENFISVFKTIKELNDTVSEKGEDTLSPTDTVFKADSVFGLTVNSIAKNDDFLICDDLGKEWADFIGIKGESIIFYHCKHGDSVMSAKAFHDIVGQALKNIGKLTPSDSDLKNKKIWGEYYKGKKVQTKIKRLIRGVSVARFLYNFSHIVFRPNHRREINLVVDFISKKDLTSRLQTLRKTQTCKGKSEVIQILWFLSSLIATCQENFIDINIYSKE